MGNLKPGDRVILIKRLKKFIASIPDDDLILICGQFGIDYGWDQDSETGMTVVVPRFAKVRDSVLEELLEFLGEYDPNGEKQDRKPPSQSPDTWLPGYLKLFLSHSSKDKGLVTSLKAELLEYGVSSFVAHQDIEPTKEWVDIILGALESCDALAALLTENFHGSNWTDQEVGYALRRGIPILPVRLGVDPYGFFGRFQGLPGSPMPAIVAHQIYEVLNKTAKFQPILAEGLVHRFITCKNYKSSHKILARLDKASPLTGEQKDRIDEAMKTNGVLQKAYGMPEKVKAFLEKGR